MARRPRSGLVPGLATLIALLAAPAVAFAGDTYASLTTLAGAPDVSETAHAVTVKIDGAVADVTLKQTFANRSKRQHEVVYRFPLPAAATVVGLSVKLPGGKTTEAFVVDAGAAITPVEDPDGADAEPDTALLRLMARTDTHAVYELRVYPVDAGASVEVSTRFVTPLRFDGGRLSLRLPSRGGAANLAAPKVAVSVTPPPGVKMLDEVVGAGKVLAREVKGGKGTWSFTGPTDDDVIVEVAPRFAAHKPLVASSVVPLGDSHGLYALTLLVPPPTQAEIPHYDRVVFFVDVSRSMDGEPSKASRLLVEQVLAALGADVQVEAVLFGRKPARVFGKFVAADREGRTALDRAISAAPYENGSDLGAALQLARPILAERTREEQEIQKKTGVKPSTLVVIVSDGLAPLALSGDRAVDRFGSELFDQAFVVSVTLYPDGTPAPGSEEPPAGQLALRAGGRSLVMRDIDADTHGAQLGAELTRPAPLRGLEVDVGAALLELDLPGELGAGQGAVVVGEYRGTLPKKILVRGRLGGDGVELAPVAAGAGLEKAMLALWLGGVGPEAFVPLSQRAEERPNDPASYRGDVWPNALRAFERAAAGARAVTPWTSLVALAPGDAFAKDRAAFVKKWGPVRFGRLPPPEELDPSAAPQPVQVTPRSAVAVAPTPRAYAPTGDIDKDIAKRLMQTYVVPQARACYLKALRTDPAASGRIDLVVEMTRGEVTTVGIAASTFKSAEVDLCVIDAAYGIQVPRVGLGSERDAVVVVRYPLHFKVAKTEPTVTDETPINVDPLDPKKGGTPISPDDPDARTPQGE